MGFDAALLVTSAKDSPLPLPLAFPPLVQLAAMPVSPQALSTSPPLQGGGILGQPEMEGLAPSPKGWLLHLIQVAVTAGEITLVTGMREGVEEGGTGALCTTSGVDPAFYLPFSKGHGVGIEMQESSEEKLVSTASTISVLNSVGQGVEEGKMRGTLGSMLKVGGVGGVSINMGTGK